MPTLSVSDLAARFSGQLLQPTDTGYDDARRVHNGLIDKRPTLIARCRNVADIVDAVNLARENNLEVAVKGGGHNVAGRGTLDAGLLIDLSLMRAVHVDPKSRTARAQGGATWGDFNRETQLHGLASTGGVISSTGVGGLTLGGGLGWLMGKYGMAIDNLRSAQVVTADGRVLTASTDENPDLFWGIRGGGGNLGIAGSFEFNVHEVGPIVTGGLAAHPFEKARDVLRFYRDTTASLPDEMVLFAGLIHSPDAHKLAGLVACHCGAVSDGEAAVRPLKAFGPPVLDALGPMPYSAVNQMLDAAYPKGALNYWKSNFLATLSDAAIDTMIECYSRVPSPMTGMLLEHFHGAATRVPVGDTAFPHRSVGYNFVVTSEWLDPADTEKNIRWTRDTYKAMEPFMGTGRYVNYLDADEPGDAAAAAYGSNYAKLQQLKAKYDPNNFFHMNLNVRPGAST
jgi:FAD/FMN-containing dehydrogenase